MRPNERLGSWLNFMTPYPDGQPPKLLDQMRNVLRLHRYALRTEKAYCDWVRRYVKFHGMKSREDLAGGKEKVEGFLTDLAARGRVSASTQNQALKALRMFCGKAAWECAVRWMGERVRADSAFRVRKIK